MNSHNKHKSIARTLLSIAEVLHRRSMVTKGIVLSLVTIIFAAGMTSIAEAVTTGPQTHVYNGHLLDSNGDAITTAHTLRFSYWNTADFVSTDLTATGALNLTASGYVGWYEEHTVTPNADGYFSVDLGTINPLPDFRTMSRSDIENLYLQEEVKVSGAADSTYELLDHNTSSDTLDRAAVLSIPFAKNADLLDQRDTGTGSGSIPVLESGGLLPLSTLPGGTNLNFFRLNADGSSSGAALHFGQTLQQTLLFDGANDRFNFSSSVHVQGNLTVTGSVTVGNFTAGTGTGAGTMRWNGSNFEGYDGSTWQRLDGAGGTFVGTTTVTTTGSISYNSFVGYQAANAICAAEFSGSHMCQVSEIISTIESDISAFTGASNGWAAEGAPGFTSDSNDCKGWTSSNNDYLGAWWEFSTDGGATIKAGGGEGFLTSCSTLQPIACCR